MKLTRDLSCVTEQEIEIYAEMKNNTFGDVIIECLDLDATCFLFCKYKDIGYNLGILMSDGKGYVNTYSAEDILEILRGKKLEITTKIVQADVKEG